MSGETILIVDDNEPNLKLFSFLLSGRDYEVKTAMSAAQALEVLQQIIPHLILLDIQLPDIDGLELTRRLKSDPRTSGICIVAVTAYAMKGDEERAMAAGADGYISKPIDKRIFREKVAWHLTTGMGR